MNKIQIWTWILVGIAGAMSVFVYIKTLPPPAGKYDSFAKCIANTSTTFYGAFWCPHCADQKRAFGDAAKYLPYHECSTPDAQHELTSCVDAGITQYPTWRFPDGSKLVGEQSFETLSAKTGCPLPSSP